MPIDFSETSRKALEYAVPFAKQFQAKITLLHVVDFPPYPPESGFLSGGIAGAVAFHGLGYSALFFPASLTAFTSLAYGVYHLRRRRKLSAD